MSPKIAPYTSNTPFDSASIFSYFKYVRIDFHGLNLLHR